MSTIRSLLAAERFLLQVKSQHVIETMADAQRYFLKLMMEAGLVLNDPRYPSLTPIQNRRAELARCVPEETDWEVLDADFADPLLMSIQGVCQKIYPLLPESFGRYDGFIFRSLIPGAFEMLRESVYYPVYNITFGIPTSTPNTPFMPTGMKRLAIQAANRLNELVSYGKINAATFVNVAYGPEMFRCPRRSSLDIPPLKEPSPAMRCYRAVEGRVPFIFIDRDIVALKRYRDIGLGNASFVNSTLENWTDGLPKESRLAAVIDFKGNSKDREVYIKTAKRLLNKCHSSHMMFLLSSSIRGQRDVAAEFSSLFGSGYKTTVLGYASGRSKAMVEITVAVSQSLS